MRITILTSSRRGIASRALPALCANTNLTVVNVILAHGVAPNRSKMLKRKIKKARQIGLLGTFNGIRLREWYADNETEDINSVCRSLNVPMLETGCINSDETKRLFREAKADLGLSLGNGYIPKSVFSIPKHGMINVHTEILPDFQGAQSIIWPIHESRKETGFTIHQIDSSIDTGDILYKKKYPIEFRKTLRETVEKNLLEVRLRIPEALSYVCENYPALKAETVSQENGASYTTPTFRQFLRMKRNHETMYRESLAGRQPGDGGTD